MNKPNEMYITGEITSKTLTEVLIEIGAAYDEGTRLHIWISSSGGELLPAFAIHDALARNKHVEAIATGDCQSAALVAFLGARWRLATPSTVFLNHRISGKTAFPEQLRLAALDALRQCPEGYFDIVTAMQKGLIHGIACGDLPFTAPVAAEAVMVSTDGCNFHSS